jgi:Predicted metal-dependent protease of the PAD1/JAB1 superfamily
MPKIVSSENKEREYKKRSVSKVPLFVSERVMLMMADHADEGLRHNKEVMGLMMGQIFRDDHGEYAIVNSTATSVLDADKISVRFDREHLEELFESMDSCEGEYVVGWYHSHLGIGCFLSDVDIKTHEGVFGAEMGFAIVIDPLESVIVPFTCFNGVSEKIRMIVFE